MKIETNRLILRKFTPNDFDDFAKLIADPEVMRFSIIGPLTDEKGSRDYFQRILNHYVGNDFGLFALINKTDQRLIGFTGLSKQIIDGKNKVELGYRLFPGDWGKGLATEACLAVCDLAFQQLGLNEIIAIIEPQNIRSVAIAKKIGMQCIEETEFHGRHVNIFKLKKSVYLNSSQHKQWDEIKILHAMQANMHLHMTFLANHVDALDLIATKDVSVVHSEIKDDTYNYVLAACFEKENAHERISDVLQIFEKQSLPYSWWVGPSDTPHNLADLLMSFGLIFKEEDVGMYLNLNDFTPQIQQNALNLTKVNSLKQIKDFSDVIVSIGCNPECFEKIYSKIPSTVYEEESCFEMHIGYLDDQPVVTAILVLHAGAAGIYFVATNPNYRKKGLGSEMMEYLLLRAKDKGFQLSTLQASQAGNSLYKRLGFKELCSFKEYAKSI